MERLKEPEQIDGLLEESLAILFKHSTRCNISETAYHEVSSFEASNPRVPIYLIDVVEDRTAAQYVAEQVSVPHQSPQVILLQKGRVVWHASHFDLAGDALQEQVETCLSLLPVRHQ
ncbi:MAG: bacillithiol system redox-active protein YtxJ [Acidobacteriota bacterium]